MDMESSMPFHSSTDRHDSARCVLLWQNLLLLTPHQFHRHSVSHFHPLSLRHPLSPVTHRLAILPFMVVLVRLARYLRLHSPASCRQMPRQHHPVRQYHLPSHHDVARSQHRENPFEPFGTTPHLYHHHPHLPAGQDANDTERAHSA